MLSFVLRSSLRREIKCIFKPRFNIYSIVARGIRTSSIMASQDNVVDEYRKKAKLAVCFPIINLL